MSGYQLYTTHAPLWNKSFPSHWRVLPMYALAKEKSICGCADLPLLSVYLDVGVIPFEEKTEKRTNVTSKDLSKYQRVDYGDFVLNNQQAWRGSVGISFHTGIVSPAYIVLSMNDTLNNRYANYLMRSQIMVDQYLINSKSVGSIQRNIYWAALKRTSVPVPPRKEQDQIVRFLDWKVSSINKLINIRKKETKELKVLQSSIIIQTVTQGLNPNVPTKSSGIKWTPQIPVFWNVARLKTLLQTHFSGAWGEEPNGVEDFLCIRIADFRFDRVCVSKEIPTLRRFTREQVEKKVLHDGDLLLEKSGGGEKTRVGRVVQFIDNQNKSMMCSNFIECLRPNGIRVNSSYLTFLLKSLYLLTEMNGYFKQTTGIQNVDLNAYLAILLPIPPREEQEQIVHFIENKTSKILKLIEIKKKEILELENYKTCLIADVVTGQMDVRNIIVPEYEHVDEISADGGEDASEEKEDFNEEED